MFKSTTFKPIGEPSTPEQRERIRAAIEKNRPAMLALVKEARRIVEEGLAVINTIQSPELRKSARR